jgi:alkaline phosphatase D
VSRGACLLALTLALSGCPEEPVEAPSPREQSAGPLVGAVTSGSAPLWIYPGPSAEALTLRYRADGEEAWQAGAFTAAAGGAWRAEVRGLSSATAYTYEVLREEQAPAGWAGRFQTAPRQGEGGGLRLALASCMHVERFPEQPSWSLLLAEQPDLLLLLGDNVYANTTEPGPIWQAHLSQRQVPSFAEVIRQIPTLAIWDDHDYGPNDAGGDEPGKSASLRAFREVYANPAYGLAETPGVFFRYAWGDVELFALDVRFYRSALDAPDDDAKRMLGDAQQAWLRRALASSTATYKLIASGSAFVEEPGKPDTWSSYSHALERLYETIRDVGGGGVLLLSGDLHRSALHVHPVEETGLAYPLYEVLSSGIGNSQGQSFAVLNFDTAVEDPKLTVSVIHGSGERLVEQVIRRSELQ